ncbi:MAG: hypothetical protein ACKVOP_03030 [Sphingomonadaceae bacterium]
MQTVVKLGFVLIVATPGHLLAAAKSATPPQRSNAIRTEVLPPLKEPIEYSKLVAPPEPGARRINDAEIKAVLDRFKGSIGLDRGHPDVGGLNEPYVPGGRWSAGAFIIDGYILLRGTWFIKHDHLCHFVEYGSALRRYSPIFKDPRDGSRFEVRYTRTFCRTVWQSADDRRWIMSNYLYGDLSGPLIHYRIK